MKKQYSQPLRISADDMALRVAAAWQLTGSVLTEQSFDFPQDLNAASGAEPVSSESPSKHNIGPTFTLAFPGQSVPVFRQALGQRIIFWPNGVEKRRRLAIVSSRMRRQLDRHRLWFGALRTILVRLNSAEECLCVVDGTTAFESVTRAAELFGQPILELTIRDECLQRKDQLVDWVRSTLKRPIPDSPERQALAIISPEYRPLDTKAGEYHNIAPARDILLTGSGQKVFVLGCRSNGQTYRALQQKLQANDDSSVVILSSKECITRRTEESLERSGAVRWLLDDIAPAGDHPVTEDGSDSTSSRCSAGNFFAAFTAGDWLSHWTRCSSGPWPDETRNDYLDSLILGCESADHSAFATLIRIADTGLLLPSQLSRNSVSFTAVPLTEFRRRRVFRPHLRRYDFEPWGFAIRRSTLKEIGAAPVEYLNQNSTIHREEWTWKQQPARNRAGRTDWTAEQEWRYPGTLNLNEIPAEDVVVFVNTPAEMQFLQPRSKWLVVVLPEQARNESTA